MMPQERVKAWGIRIAVIIIAALWLVLMATSWAEASEVANVAEQGGESELSRGSQEYNFRWLDPDKKIYVLQNRKYRKASRGLISVMGGVGFSNPYRSVRNLEGRLGFYFAESWGFEAFAVRGSNSENNTFLALQEANRGQVFPVIREIDYEYGGLLHWVPWYSKINVFNNILYFDWYFSAGAGSIDSTVITRSGNTQTTAPQTLFGLFAGTGHQYYLSQSVVFRLDLTGTFYRAPVFGTSGDQVWFSNYNFALGLGLRL